MDVTNQKTGEVQPASIGLTASPVMVGITLSIIFKLLSFVWPAFASYGVTEADTAELAQMLSLAISTVADVYAWWKRKTSKLQPIVIGEPKGAVT